VVYSTEDQVRAICDTDITDDEITELIEETDAMMDRTLDTAALGAIMCRLISRTWTAYRCMLKDPDAQALGEYSHDRGEALKALKEELDGYMLVGGDGMMFKYGYADLRWPVV